MGSPYKPPRLNRKDFEELLASHKALELIIEALGRTNWAGANGCIIGLMRVNKWVCEVYNRFERSLASWNASNPDRPLYQKQLEQTAAAPAVEQEAAIAKPAEE